MTSCPPAKRGPRVWQLCSPAIPLRVCSRIVHRDDVGQELGRVVLLWALEPLFAEVGKSGGCGAVVHTAAFRQQQDIIEHGEDGAAGLVDGCHDSVPCLGQILQRLHHLQPRTSRKIINMHNT